MDVSITAIDAERHPGVFTGIEKRKAKVRASDFTILHSGDHLSIQAEDEETRGTGARGGTPKTTRRRLVANVNKKDLQKILDAAIRANLVELPVSSRLVKVKEHLDAALNVLSGP